jgi:hypothetical protein
MSVWGKSGVPYSQERFLSFPVVASAGSMILSYVGSYFSKPQGWATVKGRCTVHGFPGFEPMIGQGNGGGGGVHLSCLCETPSVWGLYKKSPESAMTPAITWVWYEARDPQQGASKGRWLVVISRVMRSWVL